MSIKLLSIVGARPQFVKAAVLSRLIRQTEAIEEVLVHTGQHFDANMSEVFFEEMEIPKPNIQLSINSMGHGPMTGAMMASLEEVMLRQKPDAVVIYGDTNSTLAGALVASKLHIPIAHVEAGLRSFNMEMPEEINRILSDRVSKWLLCPTQTAMDNLVREGYNHIGGITAHLVGDIMLDAVQYYTTRLDSRPSALNKIPDDFILCTLHRQENVTDEKRLRAIVNAINSIHFKTPIVLPLHPGTAKRIKSFGLKLNCMVIDPVGYFDMLRLLNACSMVMTDSGGLQKEAYFLKKACVTMRDQTEWIELVEAGVNLLAGASQEKIEEAVQFFGKKPIDNSLVLYGNGQTAQSILKVIGA